jgi:hypothetical protein
MNLTIWRFDGMVSVLGHLCRCDCKTTILVLSCLKAKSDDDANVVVL